MTVDFDVLILTALVEGILFCARVIGRRTDHEWRFRAEKELHL